MFLLIRDASRTKVPRSDLLPPHVYALSVTLAIVGGVTAALTFFLPDVLTGPAVTNGNARGTALVMLALAIPVLGLSIWRERLGSSRARFLWLGSLFYLGYNAFLLLFLTPFNSLFLLSGRSSPSTCSRGYEWSSLRSSQMIRRRFLTVLVWRPTPSMSRTSSFGCR